MKVLITGGSGLIGSHFIAQRHDDDITVLTRNVTQTKNKLGDELRYITDLDAFNNLDEFDIVINLAGEPIANKRWSDSQKKRIESSRWSLTQKLVDLLKAGSNPPNLFISGSAIGFYGKQGEHVIDEDFVATHDDFSHRLCARWESIAQQAESEKTRVCIIRTGIVLSKQGGALEKMRVPFKLGVGGPIGSGTQYMSWIHLDDMLRGIVYLIHNTECSGVYNFTAPEPVTNDEFSREFAASLKRPCFFRVPAFVMSAMMGEMSTLVLDGQKVIPNRLQKSGYRFLYPDIWRAFQSLTHS